MFFVLVGLVRRLSGLCALHFVDVSFILLAGFFSGRISVCGRRSLSEVGFASASVLCWSRTCHEINSESYPFLLCPDLTWVSVGGTVCCVAMAGLSYGKWHRNLVLLIIGPPLGALCFAVVWGLRLLLLSVDLVSANFGLSSARFVCCYCEEAFS